MTTHRMGVVNGIYPGFGGPPMTDSRAEKIAALLKGCDIVASCETGQRGCAALAEALGSRFNYHRTQGTPRWEGLNGLFWDSDRFHDAAKWEWVLDSAGQWPRTLLLVRLEANDNSGEFVTAGAFHLAAKGSPLTAAQADRVKWSQVHTLRKHVGNKRAILGGDFPRTGDDDDMAYLKGEGFVFNGRTDKTPLVTITQHAVRVTGTKLVDPGSLLDHQIATTSFTLPGKAVA